MAEDSETCMFGARALRKMRVLLLACCNLLLVKLFAGSFVA